MGLWSQCFSEALRGLQVVCYGCCLDSGDKAGRLCCRCSGRCQAAGEMASRARQSGTSVSDMLRHRLFSVDNSEKQINFICLIFKHNVFSFFWSVKNETQEKCNMA